MCPTAKQGRTGVLYKAIAKESKYIELLSLLLTSLGQIYRLTVT